MRPYVAVVDGDGRRCVDGVIICPAFHGASVDGDGRFALQSLCSLLAGGEGEVAAVHRDRPHYLCRLGAADVALAHAASRPAQITAGGLDRKGGAGVRGGISDDEFRPIGAADTAGSHLDALAAACRTVDGDVAALQEHVAIAFQSTAPGTLGAAVARIGGAVATEREGIGAAVDGERAIRGYSARCAAGGVDGHLSSVADKVLAFDGGGVGGVIADDHIGACSCVVHGAAIDGDGAVGLDTLAMIMMERFFDSNVFGMIQRVFLENVVNSFFIISLLMEQLKFVKFYNQIQVVFLFLFSFVV